MPVQFGDAKVRPETYYYHPDHLGSTSWVTDQNGRVHEHVEYFPYGEAESLWRNRILLIHSRCMMFQQDDVAGWGKVAAYEGR
ncbi:MAG TPA: hypothetical protein VLS51_03585 [Propionibacteriaceae bacterium]|nr:hypothetical protein [Propionibacteriaceae bacterium]